MNRRVVHGFVISIDTFEEDGTALNDSPIEDRRALSHSDDEDAVDAVPTDQETQTVTLEYLERRDQLDIQRYSI